MAGIVWYSFSGCCDGSVYQFQVITPPEFTGNTYYIETTDYVGCATIIGSGFNSGYAITSYINSSPFVYTSCTQCISSYPCPAGTTPTPTSTGAPTSTPSNTPTRTPSRTPSPSKTVTPTSTATPTKTPTSTVTPTNTPPNTSTKTPTPTKTPTISVTSTNTPTGSITPTISQTPTNTPTNSITPTISVTSSITPTITKTPTNTPTNTPTTTPTKTPLPTQTNTPSGQSPTPTVSYSNTPTPSEAANCSQNSFCIQISFTGYSNYNGTYLNYGEHNGKSLFYNSNIPSGGYIFYSNSESRWVLSNALEGTTVLFGPTGSDSKCPDLDSSFLLNTCPEPTPTIDYCNVFSFDAVFDCFVSPTPTVSPTQSVTPTSTLTPSPQNLCLGKYVLASGSTISYPVPTSTPSNTPSNLPKECGISSTTIFNVFSVPFTSQNSKVLQDCTTLNQFFVGEPVPFNYGAIFTAVIDGSPYCVSYLQDSVTTPLNSLNEIQSGNLLECRFCTPNPSNTPTNSSTNTPTNSSTPTVTPSVTACMNSFIDFNFIVGLGVVGTINDSYVLNDGRIVIAGNFTQYRSTTINNNICIINPNGTIDNTFSVSVTGMSGSITSIAVDETNEAIYCNNGLSGYISKLNYDGTFDTTFTSNISNGFNTQPNKITLTNISQGTCDVVVVGPSFFNIISTGYIYALNESGIESPRLSGLTYFNNAPRSITTDSNNKLICVGNFTFYAYTSGLNGIVRLNSNGSIDNTFTLGAGFNGLVRGVLTDSNNNIYCYGDFTSYNSSTTTELVKISNTGSLSQSFNIDTNNSINSFKLNVSQNKIYIGGDFTSTPISSLNFGNVVAIYTTDGSFDYTFSAFPNLGTGISINVQSDDKVLLFGNFTSYNGVIGYNGILRLYPCQIGITPTPTRTPTNTVTPTMTPTPTITPTPICPHIISTITGTSSNYTSIVYNENNNYYYTCTDNGTIDIFDSSTFEIVTSITGTSQLRGMSIDVSSNQVYICDSTNNTLLVLDCSTDTIVNTISVGTTPYDSFYDYNFDNIWVCNYGSNNVSIINREYGIVVTTLTVSTNPISIAMDLNTLYVYVACEGTDSVTVISNTWTVIATLSGSGLDGVQDVVFDQNSDIIYVSNYNNNSLTLISGLSIINNVSLPDSPTQMLYRSFGLVSDEIFILRPTINSVSTFDTSTLQINRTISGLGSVSSISWDYVNESNYLIGTTSNILNVLCADYESLPPTPTPSITNSNTPTPTPTITPTNTITPSVTPSPIPAGTISTSTWTGDTSPTQFESINYDSLNSLFYVAGSFSNFDGNSTDNTVLFDSNGNYDSSPLGPNNSIYSVTQYTGDTFLIGGYFSSYNATTQHLIALVNANGYTLENAIFNSPYPNYGGLAFLRKVVKLTNNKVLTSFAKNSPGSSLFKHNLDGSFDGTFFTGSTEVGGIIYDFTPSPNESQYILVGDFTQYSGVSSNQIVSLNSGGTVNQSSFTGSIDTGIGQQIIVTNDSKYLIGGTLTSYNSTSVNQLVKIDIDGTIDTSFSARTFTSLTTITLIRQLSDNRYVIFGGFNGYDSQTARGFIVLNTDGSLDNSVNYFTTGWGGGGYPKDLYEDNNGIIVVGDFTSINGVARNGTVKIFL